MDKTVFIIVDGMGDRRIKQLNNKTPLEYSFKPNISLLLKQSECAFPSVLGKFAPESDAGVLANLGYDPFKFSSGRGWFECLGLDMQPRNGDISLRVNIGEAKGNKLKSVRTYLSKDEFKTIENEINRKVSLPVDFEFKAGVGYRAGLILRASSHKFSAFVSNTQPGYTAKFFGDSKLGFAKSITKNIVPKVAALRREADHTAEMLNKFVKEADKVLSESRVNKERAEMGKPLANCIMLRDGAVRDPSLFNISDKFGKKWSAVVGMPLEKGIAAASGMRVFYTGESEKLDDDLIKKAETVESALRQSDCVYLHIKQADSASHLGNFAEKCRVIQALDRVIIGKLIYLLDIKNGDKLVLTCDHSTSSLLKRHVNDKIPVLITSNKSGRSAEFGETYCSKHHIKDIKKATDIMPFLMEKI